MIESNVLSNGITVVTEQMPYLRSTSFGVFIKVGSVNETLKNNGIAHFIEHMLFKGTNNRTAKQIADETASIGDLVNAFTTKEFTAYYGTVITEELPHLIDILSDMLFESVFEEEAFEKEKGVIAEEIDMYEDAPDELVHELLQKEVWKSHPLGFFISGGKKTIRRMKREELVSFWKTYYCPKNMVLSVAGNFDKETLFEQLEEYFVQRPKQARKDCSGITEQIVKKVFGLYKPIPGGSYHKVYKETAEAEFKPVYHKTFCTRKKDIEQVHMNLAFPCISYGAKEKYCFSVFNSIFGGSNTSLLFQRIREEKGLAYSIYSYGSAFCNAGLWQIDVVTNPGQAETVFKLIKDCMEEMRLKTVAEEVLQTHKKQARAELILGSESARNRMEANAKSMLLTENAFSVEEVLQKIEKVTAEEIRQFAMKYIDYDKLSCCLIGDTKRVAEPLRKRIGL